MKVFYMAFAGRRPCLKLPKEAGMSGNFGNVIPNYKNLLSMVQKFRSVQMVLDVNLH